MFQKVLLATALQNWDVPTPYAYAAREVAIQLAKGSSHPLYVLSVYTYHAPAIGQNPLIGADVIQESERFLKEEEATVRVEVEAKLRKYVQPIESAGVAAVPLIRSGTPREEVVRVAREVGADLIVIGSHSKRHLFDIGGTAQAICRRAAATVVMASPAETR